MAFSIKPAFIRYGSYRHAYGQVNVDIQKTGVLNAKQQIFALDNRWTISGKLTSRDGSDLQQKIRDLESAYSQDGLDLVILTSDGKETPHSLRSADCIGGTIVTQRPSYPTFAKGELGTIRSFQLVVTGQVFAGGSNVERFSESISIRGGGWRRGCLEVTEGPAIQQEFIEQTMCVATQSGSMTVRFGFPQIPPPIWPNALKEQYPDFQSDSPQTVGSGRNLVATSRTYSWRYEYEFPFRLTGEPHYIV